MLDTTWQIALFAYFVSGWFLRIVMFFIVPRDKEPAAATAWLLLIWIEPVIGSILFAMFGQPKLPQTRMQAQVEVDDLTKSELEEIKASKGTIFKQPSEPQLKEIEKLVTALGGLPAMDGNSVKVITDYDTMLKVQTDAIKHAKEYVHLEYFIIALDKSTKPLFDAMEAAVKRGVTVRVLLDRYSPTRYPGFKKMIARLNEIGVDWHYMLPFDIKPGKNFTRPDLRNHRKILIVDGKVAYTGSPNIIQIDYHRSDGLIYEEMLLELKGPIVWQCNNVFRSDWYAETHEPLLAIVEDADIPQPVGSVLVQALPSGPSHPHSNNLMLYTALLHAAKDRISIVVPYFVPDESVMSALVAAVKRGVKVSIINSESIDKLLTGHAQRSYYDDLLDAGINLYLYKKPVFLHNKQVIIDNNVAVVGSSNLDIRSFELDLELSLVIYDEVVVSELTRIDQSYITNSVHITKSLWQERPLHLRLLDRVARLTSALQ